MNPHIFREYDIRGHAERDLTSPIATALGQAFAELAVTTSAGSRPLIIVGRDCRHSSPQLRDALVEGMRRCEVEIVDIGIVPTPQVYFANHKLSASAALCITGSHNPGTDNGFKMMLGKGSVYGQAIRSLQARIEEILASENTIGQTQASTLREEEVSDEYLSYLRENLRFGDKKLRFVVDAGNGSAGPLALRAYRALGFEPIDLFCDMDPDFPNHHPDPTVEKNLVHLQERVRSEKADLGIAFDGDGDRIGVVDSRGQVIWGDQLMLIFALQILKEHPGATFLGEVKCSQSMYDGIRQAGGEAIMYKVGHSLIKTKMKECGALLGGEMSGHIFFAHRFFGYDDAIYAGARLLELLSHSNVSLDAIVDDFPKATNTPEIRIDCPDELKFNVVEQVKIQLQGNQDVRDIVDIDGVRARFDDGWGLIRASNTQASLVMRCEASSPESLDRISAMMTSLVEDARAQLAD